MVCLDDYAGSAWKFAGSTSSVPCSGGGACVNGTEAGSPFPTLCLCDAAHLGSLDFFDLTVAVDPASGAPLTLDCPTPTVLVVVSFAVYTLLASLRFATSLFALGFKLWSPAAAARRTRRGRSWSRPAARRRSACDLPLAALLLDVFVAQPCLIAVGAIKVTSPTTAIGTDVGVTALAGVGISLVSLQAFFVSHHQLISLVRARLLRADESRRLASWGAAVGVGVVCAMVVGVLALPLAAVRLDHSKGPIESGEFLIIVVRGVIVMTSLVVSYRAFMGLSLQIRTALESLSTATASTDGRHAAEATPRLRAATGLPGAPGAHAPLSRAFASVSETGTPRSVRARTVTEEAVTQSAATAVLSLTPSLTAIPLPPLKTGSAAPPSLALPPAAALAAAPASAAASIAPGGVGSLAGPGPASAPAPAPAPAVPHAPPPNDRPDQLVRREKLMRVLAFLRHSTLEQRGSLVLFCLVGFVFMLPWTYEIQAAYLGVFTGFSNIATSVGITYVRAARAAWRVKPRQRPSAVGAGAGAGEGAAAAAAAAGPARRERNAEGRAYPSAEAAVAEAAPRRGPLAHVAT